MTPSASEAKDFFGEDLGEMEQEKRRVQGARDRAKARRGGLVFE